MTLIGDTEYAVGSGGIAHIDSIQDDGSEGGWDIDDLFAYTVKLQVITDSPTIGPKAVIASLGLWAATSYSWPLTHAATETDAFARLKDVRAACTSADRRQWSVTLEYGQFNSEGDPRGTIDENGRRDPVTAYPTLVCRGDQEDFAVTRDRGGNPILNTAGDPFDPPITRPVPYRVYEVGQTLEAFDDSVIEAYQGHVNDDEWMGFPAESVLCKSITAACSWNNDADAWRWEVKYEFAIRKPVQVSGKTVLPGWGVEVLNCGTRQLVSGEKKQIVIDNAPVSSPVNLKEDGTVADPTDDPYYLAFDIFPEATFASLGLPEDLFSRGA